MPPSEPIFNIRMKTVWKPLRKPLHIFKLPDVFLRKLVNTFELVDIVNLSMSSRTSNNKIREFIPRSMRKTMQMSFLCNFRYHTKIQVDNGTRQPFEWNFLPRRHIESGLIHSSERRYINGHSINVKVKQNTFTTITTKYERDYIRCAKYLQALFQCEVINVNFAIISAIDFILLLKSPVFHKSKQLFISRAFLEESELEYILDNYKTDQLICGANPKSQFRYSKPITYPSVEICYSRWVQKENVFQMMSDCETVKLKQARLTNEDFNEILKEWMGGESKKIKHLIVKNGFNDVGDMMESVDSRRVFEGITTSNSPPEREFPTTTFWELVEGMSSRDIVRNDGTLATVFLNQSQERLRTSFALFVW